MLKEFDEDELLDAETRMDLETGLDEHELRLEDSSFAETDERLFGDEEFQDPEEKPDLSGRERASEMIQETEAKMRGHLDARKPERDDSEVLDEMKEKLQDEFSFDLEENLDDELGR